MIRLNGKSNIMTGLLVLCSSYWSDIVLMKLDVFQGKHKVKDQWSETEYVVVCQVTEDVLAYEV